MTHGVTGTDNPGTDSGIESSETKKCADTTGERLSAALGLTNFQLTTLAIATGESKSGQEILRGLNTITRGHEENHGRLYPNLDAMIDEGLIEKGERDLRTHEYPAIEAADRLFETYLEWFDVDPAATETDDDALRAGLDLSHFRLACLVVIDESDDYNGVDIKTVLEGAYDSVIHHGRIYPNLNEMVADGLVDKNPVDRREFRYDLTDAGRRVVTARREWMLEQTGRDDGGEQ